jgi:uncharacterized protein YggE
MATITVRGHGTSSAQPDEVAVGLTVEALRPRAAEAFAESSRPEIDVTLQLEQG